MSPEWWAAETTREGLDREGPGGKAVTQPDHRPESEEPRPLNRRLAELRDTAKRDPSFLYLLPSSMEPPKTRSRRRPVLLLAVGGAVLAVAALAMVALGGSGGGGSSTPSDSGQPPSNAAVAPAGTFSQPTATPTHAIPTPTPRSAEDTVHEGAVAASSAGASVPADGPRLVTPLTAKGKVLDRFGAPRGAGYIHGGIDIAPANGPGEVFDVVAACDGTVAGIDHSGAYGDFVVVDCGNGWKTLYANMAEITSPARQSVAAGSSKLGAAVGSLHFEVRFTDTSVDPERYVNIVLGPLPPTPTPAPSPSPTATATATATPNAAGNDAGGTGNSAAPTTPPTATPVPPTLTPTSIPPTPTTIPTSTPTPRPPRRTATPPPVIK